MARFGKEFRDAYYLLNKELALTNHGASGAVPRPVYDERIRYMERIEHEPDPWFRYAMDETLLKNRDALAKLINCDPEDVVFAENVTEAINDVMWSFPLEKGEGILTTSVGYDSVNMIAKEVCKARGATYHEVTLQFPFDSPGDLLTPSAVVTLYADYINAHRDIKLVIVGHITSSTALLMPVKEIIELCHSKGVEVLVDAAHAPGHVTINMANLDADYYTGNMHKWCFTPRGCALLYVAKRNQDKMKPIRCTRFYNGNLWYRFTTQGTRDHTPYCCTIAAMAFYNMCGGQDAITKYNTQLRDRAQELLTTTWGTRTLPVSKDLTAPFMCLVGLPDKYNDCSQSQDTLNLIQHQLHKDYGVLCQLYCHQGRFFCRIGANIYNTIEDYERLATAVLELDLKAI